MVKKEVKVSEPLSLCQNNYTFIFGIRYFVLQGQGGGGVLSYLATRDMSRFRVTSFT